MRGVVVGIVLLAACGGGYDPLLDGKGLGWDGDVEIAVPSGPCENGYHRDATDTWIDRYATGDKVYYCTGEPAVGIWHRAPGEDIEMQCEITMVDYVIRMFSCKGYCYHGTPGCRGLWMDDGKGPPDSWFDS